MPAPSAQVSPPVSRPRRRSRAWLVIALVIAIPLSLLLILGVLIEIFNGANSPSTTTTQTAVPQTTLTGNTDPVVTIDGGGLPAADITAVRTPSPPVVDANGSDWRPGPQATSTWVIAGPVDGNPSAVWWISWDDQNLYVYVEVSDITLDPWSGDRDQLWRGDSANFEFGPDPRGLGSSAGLRSDDVHVLLGPVALGPSAAISAVNLSDGRTFVPGPAPDIEAMSFVVEGSIYVIEARIPWQVIGVSNPVLGAVFGTNLNISDSDGEADLRVMVSSNPARTADNQVHPGTWTTLVLGP